MYWNKRNMSRTIAEPFLRLSGILDVRKHCIAMVANSQLRASTRYMSNDTAALLSDVQLWVQSGAGSTSAERKEAIRQTLSVIEARLRRVSIKLADY